MFTVLCFYRVPKENVAKFIELKERIGEIFLSYGALEEKVYEKELLEDHHESLKLVQLITLNPGEKLLFGQSVYRNQPHYQEVKNDLKDHFELHQIYRLVDELVDTDRTITATFACAD